MDALVSSWNRTVSKTAFRKRDRRGRLIVTGGANAAAEGEHEILITQGAPAVYPKVHNPVKYFELTDAISVPRKVKAALFGENT